MVKSKEKVLDEIGHFVKHQPMGIEKWAGLFHYLEKYIGEWEKTCDAVRVERDEALKKVADLEKKLAAAQRWNRTYSAERDEALEKVADLEKKLAAAQRRNQHITRDNSYCYWSTADLPTEAPDEESHWISRDAHEERIAVHVREKAALSNTITLLRDQLLWTEKSRDLWRSQAEEKK
jgi:hypothetical protein